MSYSEKLFYPNFQNLEIKYITLSYFTHTQSQSHSSSSEISASSLL